MTKPAQVNPALGVCWPSRREHVCSSMLEPRILDLARLEFKNLDPHPSPQTGNTVHDG